MSEFVYGRDTWFAPLEIDSTNNVLVFSDNSVSGQTITVPLTVSGNDAMWLNKDTNASILSGTYVGVDYYPVLTQIEDDINTASSNTYEFQEYTPSGYPAAMGLKLVQTAGSGSFSWDFTDGSWTFNARILGYGTASPTSDDTSSGGEIQAPYSTYGTWVSHTIDGGEAMIKLPTPRKLISLSGDDSKYATRKQFQSRDYRTFVYEWVPGAHIRSNRGKDAASASTASIAEDDINNAFQDIWDLGTREAIADGSTEGVQSGSLVHLEIHHDMVNILGDDTTSVEAARFSDEGQIGDFTEMIGGGEPMRLRGEYYRLEVETLTLSTNYEQ
jgi:hypothetical protein